MVDNFIDDEVDDCEISKEEAISAALLLIMQQGRLNFSLVELAKALFFLLRATRRTISGN